MSDYLLEEAPLSSGAIYRLFCGTICPRPIAWVSTHDRDGNTNLAPFSFFNVVSVAPPVLGFSPLLNGEGQPNHPQPGAGAGVCTSAAKRWWRR